ncbi:MAG: LPXTG cell wall anchor domain-containing protein [Clostridia bacterium]|nr:LPXTG cell wall anchor domain-containing protein [Clostridia bacterium]
MHLRNPCDSAAPRGTLYADSPVFTLQILSPLPETGDESRTGLLLATCFISLAGMLALTAKNRKRRTV